MYKMIQLKYGVGVEGKCPIGNNLFPCMIEMSSLVVGCEVKIVNAK